MKKIKICFVTQQYGVNRSGIGTYSTNLINNLSNDSFKKTVICPDDSVFKKEKNICIYRVKKSRIDITHGSWFSLSYEFAKLLKKLEKKGKFDIIHFTDARESLFYNLCRKKNSTKVIGTMNDYYFASASLNPFYYKRFYRDWIKRWAYYNFVNFMERISLPRLDYVITNTDYIGNIMNKVYKISKNKLRTIYYGINLNRIKKLKKIKQSGKRILFVGGNYQRKGLPTIIKAVPLIEKSIPDIKVYVIGKDPNENKLKDLCRKYNVLDKFEFLGLQEYEKTLSYFQRSDIFAMPSLIEGFGIVFLEAMVSKIPCIGGNVGGTKELIKNSINGFVVDPGDYNKFAEYTLGLINNNKLRKKIIKQGEKTAEFYTIKRMCLETIKVYKRLLDKCN
ncbi:glycosyltransferase family 4 protein [Candidatus Woesearchaeota archaeon]|nr:glycosyltransferase family 4 protein [Candidatus Woesearchaeota archaeon]